MKALRITLLSAFDNPLFLTIWTRLHPQGLAYPTVVGAGPNSAAIHALRSQGNFEEGNLLLIDFGVDIGGYSGDISRAGPVLDTVFSIPQVGTTSKKEIKVKKFPTIFNGIVLCSQARLYRLIAEIHERLLSHCKPGTTLSQLHGLSVELLTDALLDLGVNMGTPSKSEIIRRKLYFPFYSHAVGHWLGIDVHDCPSVALDSPLVPGVVLTIEPGLYFQVNRTSLMTLSIL